MIKQKYVVLIAAFVLFFLTGCETVTRLFNELVADDTNEILLYLQKGDKQRLKQYFTAKAACEGSKKFLQDDMLTTPVYIKNNQNNCVVGNAYAGDQGEYFSDKSCDQPVSFIPTDYQVFCNEIIDLDKAYTVLGNAAIWQANDSPIGNTPVRKWTSPYGTKMKLTLEPVKGNTNPYMKRVNYKSINNIHNADGSIRGNGRCKLEMRVYKKDISASNLTPLLSLHGGSWKLRSGGFPGLESSISHYTDQGFIVFSPFYRLLGDREANEECNNASWQDMVTDVEDALKWVWRNGEALGATPDRAPALMGQSAGGHLALWLLAHPERHNIPLSRALLLYPATDLKDFASGSLPGGRYAEFADGIKTIKNFFGVDDISHVSTNDLQANAFPDLLRQNPHRPPVFIIHGASDTVVPVMQSVRLCNAYNGGAGETGLDNGPAKNDAGDPSMGSFMRQYDCGAEGSLHLFAEADHILDLKCIPGIFCQAGGENSVSELKKSLKAGRDWLMQIP